MLKDENEIRTWDNIAKYMGFSKVTAIKLSLKYNAPVLLLGGTAMTTKEKIDAWLVYLYKKCNYSSATKGKGGKKDENKDR